MTNNGKSLVARKTGRVSRPKATYSLPTNTHEMRQFLIDQMIACAKGELEPLHARAVANLAQQV